MRHGFGPLRGGNWDNGSRAGVFALNLNNGPANWNNNVGARCCRRKGSQCAPEPPSPWGWPDNLCNQAVEAVCQNTSGPVPGVCSRCTAKHFPGLQLVARRRLQPGVSS